MAFRNSEHMPDDLIRRLPFGRTERPPHLGVAYEIHQNKPSLYSMCPKKIQVRNPIGQLIEHHRPWSTRFGADERNSFVERFLDFLSRISPRL